MWKNITHEIYNLSIYLWKQVLLQVNWSCFKIFLDWIISWKISQLLIKFCIIFFLNVRCLLNPILGQVLWLNRSVMPWRSQNKDLWWSFKSRDALWMLLGKSYLKVRLLMRYWRTISPSLCDPAATARLWEVSRSDLVCNELLKWLLTDPIRRVTLHLRPNKDVPRLKTLIVKWTDPCSSVVKSHFRSIAEWFFLYAFIWISQSHLHGKLRHVLAGAE